MAIACIAYGIRCAHACSAGFSVLSKHHMNVPERLLLLLLRGHQPQHGLQNPSGSGGRGSRR